MADQADPLATLAAVFGFDRFRDGQRAVVDQLLAGNSALAIFPTGGGKSLCYQLPALLLEGITLVISPLIALMKDQIDFLRRKGVAAARLDSSLTAEEATLIYRDLRGGRLKLLYVAPERLANERFLQTLGELPISMMAVDEAHCISEWGHSFRPDYLKLAALARELKIGRVLALTATATPSVAKDIAKAFGIADGAIVHTGFYRPNLALRMTPCRSVARNEVLVERLRSRPPGPTIVYVTLQRTAEAVAALLTHAGFTAEAYHAGLDGDVRHEVQDRFMVSSTAIVVATIAFGMGIDKRDIRYVYHYNLPKGLESYAQEIGRAGRDGEPSTCELLAAADDVTVLENFAYGDTPTVDSIESLLGDVFSRGESFDISTYELSGRHDVRPLVIDTILTYLELLGYLRTTGPFYTGYKFQPLVSSGEMLGRFDATRADFLRRVLKLARKVKTWWSLSLDEVVESTGEPRERIVAALNYLEEQGDLKLQVAGARQGYRLLEPVPALAPLRDKLAARFEKRESRDVARIAQGVELAEREGCRWRYVLNYFGEVRTVDCGHCDWCEGERPGKLTPVRREILGDEAAAMIRRLAGERHAALASPRQIARFLCGLPSPRASREKLTRHPLFGTLTMVPFGEVRKFVEANG